MSAPSTASSRSVYPHPDLAPRSSTRRYGVIVYQDQVLLIAQTFAGYSLGEADIMRKAMGKKIRAMMRAEEERFKSRRAEKGYTPETREAIYDLIEPFAGYAFNKAHAVSTARSLTRRPTSRRTTPPST